ncbi:MAG: response regulator [Planctomycetales bacterium]|nr:response regulator [Planctomycetales bacterium]
MKNRAAIKTRGNGHRITSCVVLLVGAIIAITDPVIGGGTNHPSRETLAVVHGVCFLALIPLAAMGWMRTVTHLGSLVFVGAFAVHFARSGEMFQLALTLLVPVVATVLGGATTGLFWLVTTTLVIVAMSVAMTFGQLDPAYANEYARSWWREGLLLAGVMNGATMPVVLLSLMAERSRERERESGEKLKATLERFNSVTRSAYQLVFEADEDWNVISISRPTEERDSDESGKGEPQVEVRSLVDQIHPDDRKVLPGIDPDLHPNVVNCEFRIDHGSDQLTWVRMTGGTYRDQDGLKWICGLQSIESEILSREKIADMSKQESLSELCGGLAHDFNNLLTVISIYSEMLEDDFAAKEIRRAQQEASELTAALLSFSGRNDTAMETVNVHRVLNETSAIVRGLVPENIAISWSLKADRDLVRVDPSQFRQCVMNLVTNARDAIAAKGTQCDAIQNSIMILTESKYRESRGDEQIVISVSDTGVGMNPETKKRAMEPFFTTKHRSRGTGLGLSLVSAFIKNINGQLEVDSQSRVGTTVRLGIPICQKSAVTRSRSPLENPSVNLQGTVVALVEDQPQLRQALASHLTAHGIETTCYSNAEDALTDIHIDEIDVLVTDVVLPGTRGTRLAELIRKNRPGLPVIFVSGYTDGHVPVDAPHTQFLAKPFKPNELVELIYRAVEVESDSPQMPEVRHSRADSDSALFS